jgi:hypothetical protein
VGRTDREKLTIESTGKVLTKFLDCFEFCLLVSLGVQKNFGEKISEFRKKKRKKLRGLCSTHLRRT